MEDAVNVIQAENICIVARDFSCKFLHRKLVFWGLGSLVMKMQPDQ
jgi:hypothetical protein